MDPNTLAVWKNIETRLGVPLRENMVDLLLEMARVRSTDPKRIATWMVNTSVCICNAIFGSDDPMPLLSLYLQALLKHYPDFMEQIAQMYEHVGLEYVPVSASHDEFIGILSAAGSTFANGEFMLIDDNIDISRKGFDRFQLIWKKPAIKKNNPKDKPGHSVIW